MQKKIIVSIISFVVFLVLAGSTLYLSLAVLKPSIEKGENYLSASCEVLKTNVSATCDNQVCTSMNDDVWWYNTWGSSYFFVYVSPGGYGNSDYYSDDGGDDDGESDGDDDGENSGKGDDTGDSDSGGESDSGGDDSGGESDSGGGDDGDVVKNTKYQDSLNAPGGSVEPGFVSQEIKDIKKSRKTSLARKSHQLGSSSNGTQPSTTGVAPSTSGTYASSQSSGCNSCYQGVFYVSFTDRDNNVVDTTIEGLVSSDSSWVSDYLGNYVNGSYYTCYYNDQSPDQVIWWQPPQYSKGALAGTIILSILSLIFLVLSVVLCGLGLHQSHHHGVKKHHNKHHHNGGYKQIANTNTAIDNKYQSYHKTNGSYHGGYAATTTVTTPTIQPVPYYQYNQGIAQIDFSTNGGNINSGINYISSPPQYGTN